MPIKFLLLGGGVLGFFRRGGGSANFIFMGVGILPTFSISFNLKLVAWKFQSRKEILKCFNLWALRSCFSENWRRLWLSEIPCWTKFSGKFRGCWKFFTDFPAARNAIPAKVWAFSGKENGCWKIGRACGNAAGFSPPRPPQPPWVLLSFWVNDHANGSGNKVSETLRCP